MDTGCNGNMSEFSNGTLLDNETDAFGPQPQNQYDAVVLVIKRIVLPFICTVGVSGIFLTLIVLSRRNMRTSTNCYLMALSSADMMFLLILATSLLDHQFVPHSPSFYLFIIYITYAAIFMQIFLLASIWLTVLLALERYVAICKPFLAERLCSVGKARAAIILVYILAFICRLSHFWEEQVHSFYDPTKNTTIYYISGSDLSTNEHYIQWQPWIVDSIISSILPFIMLVLLNTRLIWEVRKSSKYLRSHQLLPPVHSTSSSAQNSASNSSSSSVQREELQVTIMLISVIMVFLLCQLPYVFYTAVQSTVNKYTWQPHYLLLRFVTIMLLALKSAINFVLYCCFSEKFRNALRRVLCLDRCSWRKMGRNYKARASISALSTTTKETFL